MIIEYFESTKKVKSYTKIHFNYLYPYISNKKVYSYDEHGTLTVNSYEWNESSEEWVLQ